MNRRETFDEAALRRSLNVARAGDVVFLEATMPMNARLRDVTLENAVSLLNGSGVKVVLLCDKLRVNRIEPEQLSAVDQVEVSDV